MTQVWEPYVSQDPNALWTNPEMKVCAFPKCGFADVDQDTVNTHYYNAHGKPGEPEVLAGQGKLMGGKVSKDDRMMVILESLPREPFVCPFCFTHQSSTATRIFNTEGKLLKTVRCVECKKEMRIETMRWTRNPKDFGREVGGYPGWWKKIDHDKWMQRLKVFYPPEAVNQFWDGYGDARPEFKERQKQQTDTKGYRVETPRQPESGEDKELDKYRKPDGSYDYDAIANG